MVAITETAMRVVFLGMRLQGILYKVPGSGILEAARGHPVRPEGRTSPQRHRVHREFEEISRENSLEAQHFRVPVSSLGDSPLCSPCLWGEFSGSG
jgi:hypothetical protein